MYRHRLTSMVVPIMKKKRSHSFIFVIEIYMHGKTVCILKQTRLLFITIYSAIVLVVWICFNGYADVIATPGSYVI